jgi:maltoporin
MKKWTLFGWVVALLIVNGWCAGASEEDRIKALEKKLEAMQSVYEGRIKSLENRIEELESGKPAVQQAPSAPSGAAPTTARALPPVPDSYSMEWMKQYVAQLEAVQAKQAEIAKKENDLPTLDFHGYLRSGFGINSYGNAMSPFQAPNSVPSIGLAMRRKPTWKQHS